MVQVPITKSSQEPALKVTCKQVHRHAICPHKVDLGPLNVVPWAGESRAGRRIAELISLLGGRGGLKVGWDKRKGRVLPDPRSTSEGVNPGILPRGHCQPLPRKLILKLGPRAILGLGLPDTGLER